MQRRRSPRRTPSPAAVLLRCRRSKPPDHAERRCGCSGRRVCRAVNSVFSGRPQRRLRCRMNRMSNKDKAYRPATSLRIMSPRAGPSARRLKSSPWVGSLRDNGGAAMMLVDDPSACAVFLDLDGTLIDIAAAPDLVHIPSDLVPLLARLSSGLGGALAIVTGRPRSIRLVTP